MAARHLAKRIITQVETAGLEARPWNFGLCQPNRKTIGFEGATVEDAIVGINLLDELVLYF
jgi:hypothetical protein